MGFSYNVNVLNQKGSPALYTDTFANRPNFGYAGRLFIANDTSAIYEDTGTAWVLIANVSSGAGTLQQVTTNGNTSNVGISITAGGLSTNSLTDTALTLGSVLFAGAAGLVTQDNAAFFWDDTNNRLGINTVTPSNTLDIHFAGTGASVGINNTAGNPATIVFANTGTNKWRIGNSSTNSFDIYNNALASNALSISTASNSVSFLASIKIQQGAGFAGVAGYNGIGCDSGGFFFELGTSTNNPYFNFIGLTGARTYTYPDASGTLALTSNLSSYVPYTGATTNVNLGANGITASTGTLSGLLTSNVTSGNISIAANATTESLYTYIGNTLGNFFTGVESSTGGAIFPGTLPNASVIGSTAAKPLQFVSNNSVKMTINSDGTIGVGNAGFSTQKFYITSLGTTTATTALRIEDGATNAIFNVRDDGSITVPKYANGTLSVLGTVIISTSDINLKNDDGAIVNAIDKVLKLNPRYFYWKEESEIKSDERQLGFYAQEVKEALGEEVANNNNNKKWGIHDRGLIAMLTKAIQEQQTIIESLIKRIELLENK